MRHGEISFVAPFRYTSLLWSISLGLIFFSEVPDIWMVCGILVIVGSGLYTFYRENRRRAEAIAQTSRPVARNDRRRAIPAPSPPPYLPSCWPAACRAAWVPTRRA